MANYEISREVEEDLRKIWLYGADRWGLKQANHYALKIDEMCEFLVDNRNIGRSRPEVIENLKSYPIGAHSIFYLDTEKTIYVVRILHQKMDVERHITN